MIWDYFGRGKLHVLISILSNPLLLFLLLLGLRNYHYTFRCTLIPLTSPSSIAGCPLMKEVWVEKRKHESALRLVKALVTKDNSWQFSNPGGDPGKITTDTIALKHHSQNDDEGNAERTKIDIPLLTATRTGIIEIVKEILDRFPQAAEYINDSGQNILHIASKYRRREIFDFVTSMKLPMARLPRRIDNMGNTILHWAAWLPVKKDKEGNKVLHRQALPVRHPVQLEPGPALQLQAELRWFKVRSTRYLFTFLPKLQLN